MELKQQINRFLKRVYSSDCRRFGYLLGIEYLFEKVFLNLFVII